MLATNKVIWSLAAVTPCQYYYGCRNKVLAYYLGMPSLCNRWGSSLSDPQWLGKCWCSTAFPIAFPLQCKTAVWAFSSEFNQVSPGGWRLPCRKNSEGDATLHKCCVSPLFSRSVGGPRDWTITDHKVVAYTSGMPSLWNGNTLLLIIHRDVCHIGAYRPTIPCTTISSYTVTI